jgi:Zn-dependent peptidase ImmA (M78 family)
MRKIEAQKAKAAAFRLVKEYGFQNPQPIPVDDIAMDRGVLCVEAPLHGAVARLVRKGRKGVIRTHQNILEGGRKRFAIAHELGHWELHEKESQIFLCSAEAMRMHEYKGSPMEVEANIFASELLMPTFMCRKVFDKQEPTIELAAQSAEIFGTSLTATLIRTQDILSAETVVVLAHEGKIKWAKQKSVKSGIRVRRDGLIHKESLARYCGPESPKAGPEEVPAEAWIAETFYNRTVAVTEQTWFLEKYNSTLSLLTVEDMDPEEKTAWDRFKNR